MSLKTSHQTLHQKQKRQLQEDSLSNYPAQSCLYHFPDIKQLGVQFDNVFEINHRLDILLKNHNLMNEKNKIQKTLVTRETEGGYLFKCRDKGCQAFLKFSYTPNGKLLLAKSDIEHQHKVSVRTRGRLPKIRNGEVQECYDELQLLNFRPGEIVNFIRTRFKISKPHFYGIKFSRSKRQTIKNLLMTLSKYDHFFFQCKDLQELAAHYRNQRLRPQKRHDQDVVIVVSKKMRQLYESYHGEYVLFSIFPELVLETKYSRKPNYHHAGVLYGEDSTGAVNLLFGVVFLRKSIRLAYLYVLEKLFNFLGRYPKVLITDYDQHLAQAVRRLQKKMVNQQNSIKFHLQLPNSFIINSFQARTAPQFLSILSNDLQGLLRESDRNKHEQRLKVILKACEYNTPATQDRIAELIKKYVKGNSIIYLPPMFVGLSITPYSAANQLRSKILDFFKSPRPMVLATKAIFQIFQAYPVLKYLSKEQIEARLNPPKECSSKREKMHLLGVVSKNYESSTRMKSIAKALSQPAALCFHDCLERCFTGQMQLVESQKSSFYKVSETHQNYPYVVHHVFETRGEEQVPVWRCNCFYYSKLGLPCWHEIKACIEEGTSLIPQINPFWLKDTKLAQRKGIRDFIEHDVKYWNEDSAKLCHEERPKEKIEPPLSSNHSNSQLNHGNNNNNLYNVKINENPSEMGDEFQEENYSQADSQHAGLNDLINQLNGLNNISIKENEQQEEGEGENAWNDGYSSRGSQKNYDFNQQFYDEEDLNFDQQSYQSNRIKAKPARIKMKPVRNKQMPPQQTNLQSLKANNHSQPSSQRQEDDFQNLDLNLDFGDQNQESQYIMSQSSKIGQDKQSNFDANFSEFADDRSFSFKTGKGGAKPRQEVIIDDSAPSQGNFIEQDFDQNQVNSQQDSGQEWERTSFDKLDFQPPKTKPQKIEDNAPDEFDFAFYDEDTERYVSMGKDYEQMDFEDED